MDIGHLLGYIASFAIGIPLGLIGSGGSILTVPILVYLFGVNPVLATAYSLFIVGTTSLVGAYPKYKTGLVNLKTAVIFGIPSIASVYATRKFLVPIIPDPFFSIGSLVVTKSIFLMVLFALMMLLASVSMIREKKAGNGDNNGRQQFNYPLILLEGAIVGVLTGLVGAGGGFLIIPALIFLSKLPMKQAVGTSLLIIAANSLIGFTGDLEHYKMDWGLLILVTILAASGTFIGNWLSHKIEGDNLKKGFGWFVLLMGAYIITRELFLQ